MKTNSLLHPILCAGLCLSTLGSTGCQNPESRVSADRSVLQSQIPEEISSDLFRSGERNAPIDTAPLN